MSMFGLLVLVTHDRTVSRHEAPACNRRHGTPGAALVLLAAAVHKRARDAQSATADSLRIVMWILVFARACSFVPKNCPDVPGVTFRPAHGAGSRDVAVSETAPNRHAQGGEDCRYANNDRLHEEIGRGNAGCGLLPAVRGADRRPLLDHKAEAM